MRLLDRDPVAFFIMLAVLAFVFIICNRLGDKLGVASELFGFVSLGIGLLVFVCYIFLAIGYLPDVLPWPLIIALGLIFICLPLYHIRQLLKKRAAAKGNEESNSEHG